MLCLILIVRGLLIMMGNIPVRSIVLLVPSGGSSSETLPLRLIDKHIRFAFVRKKLEASYSHMGRPSIDPELLLSILLLGYLYGIGSERKLVEELRMHLAWRWFTGLGSIRTFRSIPRSRATWPNRGGS